MDQKGKVCDINCCRVGKILFLNYAPLRDENVKSIPDRPIFLAMNFFESLVWPGREAILGGLFLLVTGFIAWYGLRYRDAEGKSDLMRLMFGLVAAVFFVLTLLRFFITR